MLDDLLAEFLGGLLPDLSEGPGSLLLMSISALPASYSAWPACGAENLARSRGRASP